MGLHTRRLPRGLEPVALKEGLYSAQRPTTSGRSLERWNRRFHGVIIHLLDL